MGKEVDLLRLLRGSGNNQGEQGGLYIVTASTATTFVFQGTQTALDAAMFVIPADMKPIYAGEKFFALPIVGDNTNRWGLIQRITREKKELIVCPYKCQK